MTPETLTDELVRNHMLWLDGQPYIGRERRKAIRDGIADCAIALGSNTDRGYATSDERALARQRVCDAINARNGGK